MNKILPSYDTKVLYSVVDVEEEVDLANELKIMSVPTMIFEHDGKIVCRFSGTKSGNEIKAIIDKYIK
jgi:thioredoxin 1